MAYFPLKQVVQGNREILLLWHSLFPGDSVFFCRELGSPHTWVPVVEKEKRVEEAGEKSGGDLLDKLT